MANLGSDQHLAGRRAWAGLAVLALPALLIAMDASVLNLAVPALSRQLHPSSAELLWIVDLYTFMVAGLLVPMGALGDRIGRRRLLTLGAAGFGVASVIAAFSVTPEMLIAARALLGIAGATLAPSTLGLIRNMFDDPRERGIAIGVWAASLSAGGALGPIVGGALLESFRWGSVFLPAVPVMVLLLATARALLPESRDVDASTVDLPSVIFSIAAVLTVVYGLKQIAQDGVGWVPAACIVAGLAIGLTFTRRQRVLTNPLIDTQTLRAPAVSASLVANTVGFLVLFGVSLFVAQYLQLVLGYGPLASGLWMLPLFAGFIGGSLLTPAVAARVGHPVLIVWGLVVAGIGFWLLAQIGAQDGLGWMAGGSILASVGLSPVFTLAPTIIVEAVPPERAGSVAAISETSTELGAALGVAVLGSIGTAIYRTQLSGGLPNGVSSSVGDAARDSLGGAYAEAGQLPSGIGSELLDAASKAFVDGVQVVAYLGAAALILLAVVLARVLRPDRIRTTSGPEASQELGAGDAGVRPPIH